MKTWNDYVSNVKNEDPVLKFELEVLEEVNEILSYCLSQRASLQLTQQELADKIGIKQSAIARMENLKAMPRLDTMIKIIKGLDLKLKAVKRTTISLLDINKKKSGNGK